MGCDTVKLSLLVVSSPSPVTGGDGLRALRSIKNYAKHFNTFLFTPWELWSNKSVLKMSIAYLRDLASTGVKFVGFACLPKVVHKVREVLNTRACETLLSLIAPGIAHLSVGAADYDIVVVLHEYWAAVYSGYTLARLFNTPSVVMLQSPPFYGFKKRFENIVKALMLWKAISRSTHIEKSVLKIEVIPRYYIEEYLRRLRYERVLRRYSTVLAVSKAIAIEMGSEWVNKVRSLDPGVTLDREDLEMIKSVEKRVREKENYIVLGGRPYAEKGLAEALISFKFILKHFPQLKLVITGKTTPTILFQAKKACKRLGIEDKVTFTGFLPREKRFEIVAKAKLVLYPSHVDSFSYAVLESLHLNTPIVGYRIPALEIYYSKCPGVELVEEGDIEALTIKAIDALEKGVDTVEPPEIKSWEEILNEEIEMITKTATAS